MNKILITSSFMLILLGGCLSIDAMVSVKGHSNLIEKFLGSGSLPELPVEIGGHIVKYVMHNNPLVAWLLQTMIMPHKTLEGHGGTVLSAALDRTGTKIVTAHHDGTAKIWDEGTGKLIHTLQGHRGLVFSAAFDITGTKIVTASYDRTAKIWDVETGKLIHTLEGHSDAVYRAEFDITGTKIVTVSSDGKAKKWDVETGQLIHTLGHSDVVMSAVFDMTGTKIVTVSFTGEVQIWDVGTGQLIHTLQGYGSRVYSAVFDRTGTKLVTASDGTAKIWDISVLHYLEQRRLSLEQVLLLSYIYAAARLGAKKGHHPDLSKYSDLQSVYESFPEAIRSVLDKYVVLQEKQGNVQDRQVRA